MEELLGIMDRIFSIPVITRLELSRLLYPIYLEEDELIEAIDKIFIKWKMAPRISTVLPIMMECLNITPKVYHYYQNLVRDNDDVLIDIRVNVEKNYKSWYGVNLKELDRILVDPGICRRVGEIFYCDYSSISSNRSSNGVKILKLVDLNTARSSGYRNSSSFYYSSSFKASDVFATPISHDLFGVVICLKDCRMIKLSDRLWRRQLEW